MGRFTGAHDLPQLKRTVKLLFLWGFLLALPFTLLYAAFLWDGVYIGATAAHAIRNTMLISALAVFLPASLLLMPPYGNHRLWIAFLLFMVARGLSMTLMAKKAIFSDSVAPTLHNTYQQ